MSILNSVNAPYEVFDGLDGLPVENGYVYVGTANTNPLVEDNRISVYWDEDLSIPAAQPIRTIFGYPSRSGKPGKLFVATSDYSILVRDKNNNLVYSQLSNKKQVPYSGITGIPEYSDLDSFLSDATIDDLINQITIQSRFAWTVGSGSPKGGFKIYRTGGSASSPTVGTPVTITIKGKWGGGDGTGDSTGQNAQAGYFFSRDGAEWFIIYNKYVDPEVLGAVYDYTTDITSAVDDALAISPFVRISGDCVINDLQVPDERFVEIVIIGKSKVKGSTGSYIIEQTNRGNNLKIDGGDFRGPIPAIRYTASDTVPHPTSYQELEIKNARFEMDSTVYGIDLYGARETKIINCDFEGNAQTGGNGIYRERSINTEVIACNFRGMQNFGILSEVSEGLKVVGGTAIACFVAMKAVDDIGVYLTQVMWDFNDIPVIISGCGNVGISANCYISTRTTSQAVIVRNSSSDGIGQNSRKVWVTSSSIVCNNGIAGQSCMSVSGTDGINISNNNFVGYTSNGLEYAGSSVTNIGICDNHFDEHSSGASGFSISYTGAECNTANIDGNYVDKPIRVDTAVNRKISNNTGFITANSGSGTILNGTTSISVAHGMAVTPPTNSICLSLTSTLSSANAIWVSAVDATNITFSVNTNPGANVTFVWKASLSNRI